MARNKSIFVLAMAVFGSSVGFSVPTDHFTFKVEGGYIKFNDKDAKELKNEAELKVEGQIEHRNLYIKAGDVYKGFRRNTVSLNSTEPTPTDLKEASPDTNILYIKGGTRLQGANVYLGGMLSAGSGALPRLRAINLGVKTRKFIVFSPVAGVDLGLFSQYSKLKRGDYKADVVQLTPSVYITYSKLRGRVYVNLQTINSNYDLHGKSMASGGVDITADLNDKISLVAGIKLGKSLYLSEDGENFDIFPREKRTSIRLGTVLHLSKTVDVNLKGTYQTYRVIDVKKTEQTGKVETTIQRGFGIQAGVSMKF